MHKLIPKPELSLVPKPPSVPELMGTLAHSPQKSHPLCSRSGFRYQAFAGFIGCDGTRTRIASGCNRQSGLPVATPRNTFKIYQIHFAMREVNLALREARGKAPTIRPTSTPPLTIIVVGSDSTDSPAMATMSSSVSYHVTGSPRSCASALMMGMAVWQARQ